MNTEFTPGPWDYDSTDFEVYDMESGESLDITEANARLIAAAPELLQACHAFVEYEQTADADGMEMMFAYSALKKTVYAAINKATGVSA